MTDPSPPAHSETEGPLDPREALGPLRDRIAHARGVVILTGAGVSAESGVPTFRGTDGHWGRFRPEELATPEAFARDPRLVWEWYDLRRQALGTVEPNPGHGAVARFLLQREDATLVTQNVDGLHARALAEEGGPIPHPRIHELHGSIARLACARPSCTWSEDDLRAVDASSEEALPRCPEPGCGGLLRPGVVWFGEMLPEAALEASFRAAARAELCIVAGTSALVHPAASVPLATLRAGGGLIEVNPEPTPLSSMAEACVRGASGVVLPLLLPEGKG